MKTVIAVLILSASLFAQGKTAWVDSSEDGRPGMRVRVADKSMAAFVTEESKKWAVPCNATVTAKWAEIRCFTASSSDFENLLVKLGYTLEECNFSDDQRCR